MRRILTNIFGQREILTYVMASEKAQGFRRLFFSPIFPHQMQICRACHCQHGWQEKVPLNQTGSSCIQHPHAIFHLRWNIEVGYYEQKTFLSLCSYMIRSRKGGEMLVNLINVAYCAMKILPYQ